MSKERIILNVGGIKYETYRSTLTAYPDTMLGTMFGERNELLRPVNGNEYYIDRNGRLFYCILQFYRTGKIPRIEKVRSVKPITQKQLDEELDYFMIPRPKKPSSTPKPARNQKLSLRSQIISSDLDEFVLSLKTALDTVILYFQKRFIMSKGGVGFNITLEISFYNSGRIPQLITVLPTTLGKSPVPLVTEILNEYTFGAKAFALLTYFGDNIGDYLEANYPGLYWDLQWFGEMCRVKMSLCDRFEYEDIINSCCLNSISLKCY